MHLRAFTVLGPFVLCMSAFAQPGAIPTPVAAPIDSFQVGFAANLNLADSFLDLTNTGTLTLPTGLTTTGNLCVNVYVFDPGEELVSCCSCLVTPNGLNSLSVMRDLVSNTLTPGTPTSVAIKLLATTPLGLSPSSVIMFGVKLPPWNVL
jgi:hypothetical protein